MWSGKSRLPWLSLRLRLHRSTSSDLGLMRTWHPSEPASWAIQDVQSPWMILGDWKLTWCDRRKLMMTTNVGEKWWDTMGACTEVFLWKPKDPPVKTGNCYWGTWTKLVPSLAMATKSSDEREAAAIIVYEHFFLLSTFGPHPKSRHHCAVLAPFCDKTFCKSRCGTSLGLGLNICIGLRQVVLLFTAWNRLKSTLIYSCSKHERYYYYLTDYIKNWTYSLAIYICILIHEERDESGRVLCSLDCVLVNVLTLAGHVRLAFRWFARFVCMFVFLVLSSPRSGVPCITATRCYGI